MARATLARIRDRGGTGFWHETYFRGGQIESVYIDMPGTGLAKLAPVTPAVARCFQPAAWACGKEAGNQLRGRVTCVVVGA